MKNPGKPVNSLSRRQSGFSLFEVLITMVVSAVGLMSLAALQAAGVRSNQSAYQGSQAAVLAYDIADKMRANTVSINNYLTSYMTLAQATAAGVQTDCKTTTGCTSAELAQNDLLEWHAALNDSLPSPTGIITLDGSIYTVTVNWDDNRDGVVDADDTPFQVSFQP
jgi:type IV pilus assembly protein PilV